jgi:hypothetical protein
LYLPDCTSQIADMENISGAWAVPVISTYFILINIHRLACLLFC